MRLLAVCFVLLVGQVHAQNKGLIGHSLDKASGTPYGMAGCGLGSVLFGETENQGGQILAGTTNSLYSNNTFGMTSGTSNCTPEQNKKVSTIRKNIQMFVEANKEAVATDISKSNGETIVTLSNIIGCEDKNYLGSKLQSRYERIFNSKEDKTVANNLFDTVANDSYLVENCKL